MKDIIYKIEDSGKSFCIAEIDGGNYTLFVDSNPLNSFGESKLNSAISSLLTLSKNHLHSLCFERESHISSISEVFRSKDNNESKEMNLFHEVVNLKRRINSIIKQRKSISIKSKLDL